MSSSKKKAILTIGGLSLTGALGAWVYYNRKDYDEDNPKPLKPTDKVKKSDLRLKQVQVIFRHGARTPIHLIPNVEEVPLLHILIFFFSFHMSWFIFVFFFWNCADRLSAAELIEMLREEPVPVGFFQFLNETWILQKKDWPNYLNSI